MKLQTLITHLATSFALILPLTTVAQNLPDSGQGFTEVFTDEFDALQTADWCSRLPYGGGAPVSGVFAADPACTHRGQLDTLNDEIQLYREGIWNDIELHQVDGGALSLHAVRTGPESFVSAMIRSKFVFEPDTYTDYYVTAVTRAPHQVGTWPTFWLVPSTYEGRATWPPELDINEAPNNRIQGQPAQGDCVDGANSPGNGLVYQHGQRDTPPPAPLSCSARHGWLQSGILWTNKHACFTLADQWDSRPAAGLLESVSPVDLNISGLTNITCQPYEWKKRKRDANAAAIIFNLAIGGTFGGGNPTGDSYQFDVDSVRIFQKCRDGAIAPNAGARTSSNEFGEIKFLNCLPESDGGGGGGGGDPTVYCKGKSNKPANCTPRR